MHIWNVLTQRMCFFGLAGVAPDEGPALDTAPVDAEEESASSVVGVAFLAP